MEEEKKSLVTDLLQKSITKIQHQVKKFLQSKQIRNFFGKGEIALKEDFQTQSLSGEQMKQNSTKLSKAMQKIPYEIWLQIFSFIPDLKQIISLSEVCNLFNEICKVNMVWMPTFKYEFPLFHNKLDFSVISKKNYNWKGILKEKANYRAGLICLIQLLTEKKESGNLYFKQNDQKKARSEYKIALDILNEKKEYLKEVDELLSSNLRIKILKIIVILYSNISLVEYNLQNYPQSLMSASKAQKRLTEIKKIIDNSEIFNEEFEQLEKKILHRIENAWQIMPTQMSFAHHSDIPVETLQVGTMLTHNNNGFGGGIFSDSLVLMTAFDRNTSEIEGLIINKNITGQNGNILWIGGPCEMNKKLVLHNVPNIEGATRIIEGVYYGGNVSQYINNTDYKVRNYYGYASWFSGQLDGEIRNGNGWEISNSVTASMVFEPTFIRTMSRSDLQN